VLRELLLLPGRTQGCRREAHFEVQAFLQASVRVYVFVSVCMCLYMKPFLYTHAQTGKLRPCWIISTQRTCFAWQERTYFSRQFVHCTLVRIRFLLRGKYDGRSAATRQYYAPQCCAAETSQKWISVRVARHLFNEIEVLRI
jgi:hypothetical protein